MSEQYTVYIIVTLLRPAMQHDISQNNALVDVSYLKSYCLQGLLIKLSR